MIFKDKDPLEKDVRNQMLAIAETLNSELLSIGYNGRKGIKGFIFI